MRYFTRYPEAEKKSGALLDMEWRIMCGGYLHVGQNNWTLAHRFALKGRPEFGTQKEYIFRVQLALDFEPRHSWFTLELINFAEARLIYLWVKLWPGRNLKFVLNLGWRMTREAKRQLENQLMERERRSVMDLNKNLRAVRGNGTPSKEPV